MILAALALAATAATTAVDRVDLPGFGTVNVYRPEPIENARHYDKTFDYIRNHERRGAVVIITEAAESRIT